MELNLWEDSLSEQGKQYKNHFEITKSYFKPEVQKVIEEVWKASGRVIFRVGDSWNSYNAIVK